MASPLEHNPYEKWRAQSVRKDANNRHGRMCRPLRSEAHGAVVGPKKVFAIDFAAVEGHNHIG